MGTKLKLNLDTVVVESFAPGNDGEGEGTILGHDSIVTNNPTNCVKFTCAVTCAETCEYWTCLHGHGSCEISCFHRCGTDPLTLACGGA